ncbi:AMP-binding protein, partial [bacterium]|nr:AMP-binding protein [bacterium]
VGELTVQGPSVMQGYYNLPLETSRALRNGWLHTGDIAYQDIEGYFFIVDRLKDMIIINGENVYPREIEELLYA